MHSRSARVSTSVSKALARLNWTVSVWGTAPHCTGGPPPVGGRDDLSRRPAHWRAGWGTWVVIGKDHAVDIRNPATGEVLTTIESLTAEQTDAPIAKAAAAFEEWRAVAPGDRARLLPRFAAAVDADIVQLAALEGINAGHVVGNARWEAGNVR